MKTPMMNELEYNLIVDSLSKDKTMLEWGSGTSTTYFSQFAGHIDAIEHNPQWATKVREMLSEHNVTNVSLHEVAWNFPRRSERSYYYIENGEQHFSHTVPGDLTEYYMFENYINYVRNINKKYDVVLIDGRARFWCAESVLPYLNDDATVFIHDFWSYTPEMLHSTEYEKYQQLFTWYDEVESIKDTEQTIIKLKKK